MYLANTTKQHQRLNLRVPESRRIFVYDIPSGQQIAIGAGWNRPQTESVVNYLQRFGAKPVSSISGNLSDYDGLLYSLEKPIKADQIENGHAAVVDNQQTTAVREITKTALGIDAATRDRKTRRRRAKTTSLSVSQDLPHGVKPTGSEVKFDMTVAEDGHGTPPIA